MKESIPSLPIVNDNNPMTIATDITLTPSQTPNILI